MGYIWAGTLPSYSLKSLAASVLLQIILAFTIAFSGQGWEGYSTVTSLPRCPRFGAKSVWPMCTQIAQFPLCALTTTTPWGRTSTLLPTKSLNTSLPVQLRWLIANIGIHVLTRSPGIAHQIQSINHYLLLFADKGMCSAGRANDSCCLGKPVLLI